MGTLVAFDFCGWLEVAERQASAAGPLQLCAIYLCLSHCPGYDSRETVGQMPQCDMPQLWPALRCCRHNLQVLRAYCLECLMHLLVAPGCTRQREEPGVRQLQWEALRWAALCWLADVQRYMLLRQHWPAAHMSAASKLLIL